MTQVVLIRPGATVYDEQNRVQGVLDVPLSDRGKALGLRPRRIDELRNLDQGLWQGLQIDEIKRRNFRVFRMWLDDPLTVCPPLGESVEDALGRIRSALRPLIKRHQGEAIGLVVGEPLAQLVAGYLRRDLRP